jgi:hypothetical protein
VPATLKLVREGAGIELPHGPFEIQLDGRSADSITHHQTVDMPLAPGDHTLRLRKGRYSSQEPSSVSPMAKSSTSAPTGPWSGHATSRPSSSPT